MIKNVKLKKIWPVLIPLLVLLLILTLRAGPINTSRYIYNDEGRIEYKILPGGEKVEFNYDAKGQLMAIAAPGLQVHLAYDDRGNMVSMQDDTGKTEYHYDELNRPVEVIYQHSPEKRICYEYDPWNRVTLIRVLDENDVVEYQVSYEYDLFGNLLAVDGAVGRIEYAYNLEKGEAARSLPNGVESVFSFLPGGELSSLRHLDKTGVVIASYQYQYDAAGRVVEVQEQTPQGIDTTKYTWDERGYLAALEMRDGQTIHYQYDAMGNRITKEGPDGTVGYAYDGFGQIIKAGDSTFEHDANGNLNSISGADRHLSLEYDIAGQLIEIQSPEESLQHEYRYDGLGSLTWSSINEKVTSYLPLPLNPNGFVLAEYTDDGKRYYTYGENLLSWQDTEDGTRYFLEDGFNSLRVAVDQEGEIVGRRDYSPFGEITSAQGEMPGQFRTAGERYLPEADLYLIGDRPYDPWTGRYLTPDTVPPELAHFDTFNRYAHGCRNAGVFMAPRCNQTHKRVVFVGGINVRLSDLTRIERQTGIETISTSWLERTMLPSWGESMCDMVRAPLNYMGLPGGKGQVVNQLLDYQRRNPGSELSIRAHSNGAITIYNSRSELARHIREGNLIVTDIRIAGAGLAEELQHYFDKEGIMVNVTEENPANRFSDIVRVLTTPQKQLAREVGYSPTILKGLLIKLFAAGAWTAEPFVPGEMVGTAHHGIELNYPNLLTLPLPQEEQSSVRRTSDWEPNEDIDTYDDIIRKFPPFPPDDHGGGGGAGIGLPQSPFAAVEDQLGGISLGTTMEFTADFDLGNIAGAVWDVESQCLVLLGEENTTLPSLDAADLAVALKSIFDSRQEPAFSLDPVDPKNPSGPYQQAVYFGPIEGTPFGQAMFDADWRLKEYSFGISRDETGQTQEIESNVPGYKDILDLSFEQPFEEGKTYMRFWITCDDAPVYQEDGAIYFGHFKMKVNTEKMFLAKKGIVSSGGKQDPVAEAFAAHFTEHYDEFAEEEPAFAKVKELAKAVALAQWLYEQNIPVDMDWVEECLAKSAVDTPEQVPTLSRTETREERETKSGGITIITYTYYLCGGVDLAVEPRYVAGGEELSELKSKIEERTAANAPVFEVTHANKNLEAVILPLTLEGEFKWGPGVEQDGIKYYPTNGQVTKAVDDYGNTAEFNYAPDGQLAEITWKLGEGYEATARREEGHETLEMITSDQNHISYYYDASGELNEVWVNGKTYCSLSSGDNMLEIDYGQYVERLVPDDAGHVTSYQVGCPDSPGRMRTLSFAYDEQGNLATVSGLETGRVAFIYAGDKLSTVSVPGEEITYIYDGENRLKEVSISTGKAVEYSYEGDELAGIWLRSGVFSAKGVFEEGRMIESTDFFGAKTEYEYTPDGRISRVTDAQGWQAAYEYDERGQLQEVHLPDGSRIEYEYASTEPGQLAQVNIYPGDGSGER